MPAPARVVVVGGGFGGLQAVKVLGRAGVDVTLIDRHNYFLFQPLTYQVATGGLAPGDIAMPLRHIVRRRPNVRVLMGEVTGLDLTAREVAVEAVSGEPMRIGYDALIVAAGSDYAYFGHDEWRAHALEVKSLESALSVRARLLSAFEAAEACPEEREAWLTFVVVGAGPTGVEMAGQIAELARRTLAGEYRRIDPAVARVLLIETGERVLPGFRDPLPRKAAASLERIGVTLLLGQTVVGVGSSSVTLASGDGSQSIVDTRTVVWAAGVTASPLAGMLAQATGAEVDPSGRVILEPDLSLPGHPEVLALGDMVRVRDADSGRPQALPGMAPVAMQQGRYAGRLAARRLASSPEQRAFRYRDKGSLATIGRASGVADVAGRRFSGFPAWLLWLVVHIFYLIGFENRVIVLLRWAYGYFTRGRGNRLITHSQESAAPSVGSHRGWS